MSRGCTKSFNITTRDGFIVQSDYFAPAEGDSKSLVVICHGFKGHRRWGFLPELAYRLAQEGIAALSIDFSHNGYHLDSSTDQKNAPRYTRPDLFRKNTITRELEDLTDVIHYIAATRMDGVLTEDVSIGLFGHSRGGFVALLHALEKEGTRAICTWATPSNLDYFSDFQKQTWRQRGFYEFLDSRSGCMLTLDITYLNDLEANTVRYHLIERVRGLRLPHLLVHGSNDLVVPIQSSESIHRAEEESLCTQLLILKTGHTFGSTDSVFNPSVAFDAASRETIQWFHKHLNQGV